MKLVYRYNPDILKIEEKPDGKDVEFNIQILKETPYLNELRKVRNFFDENDVYTDVLFYAYADHKFQVIVRQDYYNDFIIELIRHHLLQSIEWVD
ncbi:MAG: hypothetical protein WB502_10705 [Thermoactinomyces sp.]